MRADEYQEAAARTMTAGLEAPLTEQEAMVVWNIVGLAGEAGELVEHAKKGIFHRHGTDAEKVAEELGDLLWYAAGLATTLELSLGDIMQANIDKLRARYPDGFSVEASQSRGDRQFYIAVFTGKALCLTHHGPMPLRAAQEWMKGLGFTWVESVWPVRDAAVVRRSDGDRIVVWDASLPRLYLATSGVSGEQDYDIAEAAAWYERNTKASMESVITLLAARVRGEGESMWPLYDDRGRNHAWRVARHAETSDDEARGALAGGDEFPYDATDAELEADDFEPPQDWAHRAARGVMHKLQGYRGIDNVLHGIDDDDRVEIVAAVAAIIRTAHMDGVK